MKAAKVTLIVLIAAAATIFVKADRSVDLRRTLPFCDGAAEQVPLGGNCDTDPLALGDEQTMAKRR